MATPIPYPYIRSLPPEDQARLKRDFDAVLAQITSTKVYDAYVDPQATADNTGTRTFSTIFAAVKYVVDTLGQTWCNIGVIVPTAGSNIVNITETGNYTGTGTAFVQIDAIGASTIQGQAGRVNTQLGAVNWDLQGFTDSGKFNIIQMRGLFVNSNMTTGNSPFQNASAKMNAEDCYFNFNGHARLLSQAGASVVLKNCYLQGVSFGGATANYVLDGCVIQSMSGEVIVGTFLTRNCRFTNMGNVTYSGTTTLMLAGASFTQYSAGTAGSSGQITVTSGAFVIVDSIGEEGAQNQGLTLIVQAGIAFVWIEGRFWSLNVAAPAATGTGVGNAASHHIHADVETTFDITGPANLAVQAYQGGNFLRGEALVGSVMAAASANTGVGVSFVGVKDSVLLVAFQAYATVGTGQAYAIDAASTNNTIITAGAQLLPVAPGNSSTTTIVINNTATFPISGRDRTGDELNKDLLPSLLTDANGVVTTPAAAPGSAPTGPAGNALTGTYPNPALAGRDASVDKINQDLLPSLLTDANGIVTTPAPAAGSAPTGPAGNALSGSYPNPAFAGRDASVDKLNQDMLPSALGGAEGVLWVPGPLGSYVPDTPAPLRETTAGTTAGTTGGTNEGYRKALRSYIDKAQNADAAIVMVDQVYNGVQITDGALTAGTLNHLTSISNPFTAAMVGQHALCPGFIPAGTTITAFNSAGDVTLSNAGNAGTSLVVDINPLLKVTGVHAKLYSPRDNGGDTSAVLGVQSGGGGAGTFYKTAGLRPAGSIDYSNSQQGAVEAFTDGGSQAIIAISGGTIFGIIGHRAAAVYARIDNSISDGIIIAPNDAVMDKRIAWAVGNKNIDAAPTNVQARALLDGTLETKGLLTAGGVAMTPSDDSARGIQTYPAIPDPRVLREKWLTPNAAPTFETFPRLQATANGAIVNGTIFLGAIALPAGWKISNLQLAVHTTGAAGPTHWWLALCDNAFVQLAVTADQLTGVLPSDFNQRIALTAPFTTTYEGVYYIAMMIAVATTMPTMFCSVAVTNNRLTGLTNPKLYLTGLTAQTVPQANGTNLAPVPGTTVAFPWLTAD